MCLSIQYRGFKVACALMVAAVPVIAGDKASHQCPVAEVTEHVREQFRVYGPQSQQHEYFGFVYEREGRIASAVVRSGACLAGDRCTTNTASAARQIPRGARVLGEWHTHPITNGSRGLSKEDVRGAYRNRHIPCYTSFYSGPGGDIYRWDVRQTSVPTAMSTRERIGNLNQSGPRVANVRPLAELPGNQ